MEIFEPYSSENPNLRMEIFELDRKREPTNYTHEL
jgi:hypothetical protein